MHVVLKVVEVVTHELCDDPILFRHLLLYFHHLRPQRLELLLKGLDPTKLLSLHHHHVIQVMHRVVGLNKS